MQDFLTSSLNIKVDNTLKKVSFLNSSMLSSMYNAANFTSTGKANKSPLWSKRGHIAEIHHQFTFMINSACSMSNENRFGVASDKVGINMPKVSKNNPLVDVQLFDAYKNNYYNYQCKICKTPEASMAAATKKKYVDNNVIPLVPQGHSDQFDKIQVDGISSDPISVEQLDTLTEDFSDGNIYSYIQDKRPQIFFNSLKYSVYSGITYALQKQLFDILLTYDDEDSDKKTFGDRLTEFAFDSINQIFYSSANVGLTLYIGDGLLASVALGTFRDAIIHYKLYLEGVISFDDFAINVAASAVTSTVATSVSLAIAEGLSAATIKRLIPTFKFCGIVLAVAAIACIAQLAYESRESNDSRWERVRREREMLYEQYCNTKENVNEHFNQLSENLQDVMRSMVGNVVSTRDYFNQVNTKLLDIDLSNEAMYYDELNTFKNSIDKYCVDFIS